MNRTCDSQEIFFSQTLFLPLQSGTKHFIVFYGKFEKVNVHNSVNEFTKLASWRYKVSSEQRQRSSKSAESRKGIDKLTKFDFLFSIARRSLPTEHLFLICSSKMKL